MSEEKDDWSEEVDDFANNRSVQEHRARIKAQDDLISFAFQLCEREYALKKETITDLVQYAAFCDRESEWKESRKSLSHPSRLRMTCIGYYTELRGRRGRGDGSHDYYLMGSLRTKKSFPNTYVKKETISERIMNLFVPVDVDFNEAKLFSKRFNVITNDEEALRKCFNGLHLDALIDFPDMELEFRGHDLVFRNSRKALSREEAEEFRDMVKVLVRLFV